MGGDLRHDVQPDKTRGGNTHFFHFYRVLPKLALLNARLVLFPELDASVFGFALSDRL